MSVACYDDQLRRIYLVTGTQTQQELAYFLGVQQSAVSRARKQKKIPADWLLFLLQSKDINPEWVLTGQGNCFVHRYSTEYAQSDSVYGNEATADILQQLSSRDLVEELLRRLAMAQSVYVRRRSGR